MGKIPQNDTKLAKDSTHSNPPPVSPSAREGDKSLAQVYHYDLFGKRKDKYDFLQSNGLDSIAWSELAPKAPFYLFIPQNEALRESYDKGISVKDIFKVSSVGIVTGKDSIPIAPNEKILESQIREHYKEFDKGFVQDIEYRPFDIRKIYYDKSKVERYRGEVMKHFLNNDNVGLNTPRQLKNSQGEWNHALIQNAISDQALTSGGNGAGVVHPLYLKTENESHKQSESKSHKSSLRVSEANAAIHKKAIDCQESTNADSRNDGIDSPSLAEGARGWVENFTPKFRAFIDAKYGIRFTPEQILGYIYAILYHKDYREKYVDFLKIDFPKIPFVESKEKFLALSKLGCELIDLHLMREPRHERERERERVMRNIGLNVARQSKVWGAWQYAFVTNSLVDLSLMGGGNTGAGHIFPLYLISRKSG